MSEYFSQSDNANKVDILIVDDNSGSMETKQKKMAMRFQSFISSIQSLDYQIGITTTDLSGPNGSGWATDGRLVPYTSSAFDILTPSTPGAESLFLNTIPRAETIGCNNRTRFPYCPSANEEPLRAINLAMGLRHTDNAGFFRDGVDFVAVILSDEDEMSDGKNKNVTRAADVVKEFKAAFAETKRFMAHAIIIKPGDNKCLDQQIKEVGIGYYGVIINSLVSMTRGRSYSICDTDYGKHLSSISQDVLKLVSSFDLQFEPKAGATVEVTLSPALNIPWSIQGKQLVFATPPPAGTRIGIRYEPK